MKELQELRNEILTLRNYGVINKEEEKGLLTKLNSVKEQCDIHVVMHWVVCKEELPKKEGNYLINWDGVVLEAEFYKEDKIWISEEGMLYENVTHWMRLPEPPCG